MNEWITSGNTYILQTQCERYSQLPNAVYSVVVHPKTGQLVLTKTQDNFAFGYKIYGMDSKFINHTMKTYENTNDNLGVLLSGVKGSGKTVTAKLIANRLKLPVLVIPANYKEALPNFINEIKQDIIVFIDEYEKIYYQDPGALLTVMDGVLNNGFRRVFLLTTNDLAINVNMIQRPGRIRYLKKYEDLGLDIITEIVDDMLVHPELRDTTIEFISTLDIITVDIVISIIEEVNIHKEDPKEFEGFFNIAKGTSRFNVFLVKPAVDDKPACEEMYREKTTVNGLFVYCGFTKSDLGNFFTCANRHVGIIREVHDKWDITVELTTPYGDFEELTKKERYHVVPLGIKHKSFCCLKN